MIADATADDTEALIALWEDCGLTRAWNPPARDLALALDNATSTILIARDDAAIVGSVMIGFDGHRGWIYYLAVAPAARRNGLGGNLMAAAEAWLRARGAPKVQFMVREGNEDALHFYRTRGYADQPVVVLGRMLD